MVDLFSTFWPRMLGILFLARLGFKQMAGFVDFAGLFQRLSLIIEFTWIALQAVKMFTISHVSVLENRGNSKHFAE
ncbi:MAG: hypothetical protein PVJ21_15135 [Anaerolineales bacterium]|jgi:hypothetical protein